MKKALVGAAVVVVVIAGVAYLTLLADEPPIRVRNGSIALHAGISDGTQWEWKDTGNGYDHEPGVWSVTWHLWVRVDPGTGSYSCSGTTAVGDGDRVEVTFLSDGSERKITFNRVGPPWNVRTKVQPKPLLNPDGTTILKSMGEGYVTKVVVGALTCTFAAKESLEAINICMSGDDTSCQ
jgi:hypothetical protein